MRHATGILVFTIYLMGGLHLSYQRSIPSSLTYTAAVVEYAPPLGITMDNKEEHFRYNVDSYRQFTEKAALMGADIIVFPEYGLVSLGLPRNPDGSPALAFEVPTPSDGVNPCLSTLDGPYEALRNLSCSARDSVIYMVVNLPERSYRDNSTTFYNTNVVFDRDGTVIARYRKFHLFGELGFSEPSEPDLTVFDTDFGVRFGTFICFDLMFEEPGTKLVHELGVRDIVFPTAWFSELPFLTALQAQAGWAHAMDVNFLGAGYNFPEVGSAGSGIYNGKNGAIVVTMPETRGSSLLVCSVPKKSHQIQNFIPSKVHVIPLKPVSPCDLHCLSSEEDNMNNFCPEQQLTTIERPCVQNTVNLTLGGRRVPNLELHSGLLLKREHLENYVTQELTPKTVSKTDKFSLTIGDLQCNFKLSIKFRTESLMLLNDVVNHKYQPQEKEEEEEDEEMFWDTYPYSYHLLAYDGVRSFDGIAKGGLQVCAVILCANDSVDSCGISVENPDKRYSSFETLEISGKFNADHSLPMPSTLIDDTFWPVPATNFDFETKTLPGDKVQVTMKSTVEHFTFLTFGIYGRKFVEDSW